MKGSNKYLYMTITLIDLRNYKVLITSARLQITENDVDIRVETIENDFKYNGILNRR